MKYYLLIVDSANAILDGAVTRKEYVFSIRKTADLKADDLVAVFFNNPINEVRMLLEISRDSSSNQIYFKKIIDASTGVSTENNEDLAEVIDMGLASASDLIEIDENLFEDIKDDLVSNVQEILEADDSMRVKFKKYITNVLNLKNTDQVRALEVISRRLEEASVLDKSIYSITDIEEYKQKVQVIKNSQEYKQYKDEKKAINPKSGLACDQGITNYGKFLEFLRFINGDNIADNEPINYGDSLKTKTSYKPSNPSFCRNKIYFGAPGTGKSWQVNEDRKELLSGFSDEHYERVTFHPDYSYANFVGTYRPVMAERKTPSTRNKDVDFVISQIRDNNMSSQEKYELLFEQFRDKDELGLLSILLGIQSDESFRAKKKDGSYYDSPISEYNYGKNVRKYVNFADIKNGEEISYEYVPGPFMRVLAKALRSAQTDTPEPYLLIIEEINRANAAAVFGEIFQLLDRSDKNDSEYSIQASEDIKKYLAKELKCSPDFISEIRIPDNMFIWATMNSADQGVFPMDTAFKRRWDFKYLGIDEGEEKIKDKTFDINGKKYNWNDLRKAINEVLSDNNINEDKLMGPFFISPKTFDMDNNRIIDAICNKVIMYLFEDAAKQKKDKIFSGSTPYKYSKISSDFKSKGLDIFIDKIKELIPDEHNGSNEDGNREGVEEIAIPVVESASGANIE